MQLDLVHNSNDGATVVENKPTEEEKLVLKAAAVTLSELGDYSRATSLLEKLSKEKPSVPDVYRLLGEVKYELKDYEGSAAAYKSSASLSEAMNFEVLRGLTSGLLAGNRPDEAVLVLLASREHINLGELNNDNDTNGNSEVKMQDIDPIQGIILKENGKLGDAVRMFIQARLFNLHLIKPRQL